MQKEFLETSYRPAILASLFALCTSFSLIILKGIAWLWTGSTLILASLADSTGDFIISFINFIALREAKKPADHQHRYGHGKIEGLASVFQGSLISAAGFFVLLEALHRLAQPMPVHNISIAIGVMVISIIFTLVLVWMQRRSMKKSYSLAIEADQAHYKSDIIVNVGIIIVLGSTYFGAPVWIDPFASIFVSVYLGFNAWHIAKKGVDMLLDREVGGDTREKITKIVLSHAGIHGMHDLRTRYNGQKLHVAFDVEMEPDLLLCNAHKIVKDLEEQILKLYPNSEIMIHKDPIGETDDSRHQVKGVHI